MMNKEYLEANTIINEANSDGVDAGEMFLAIDTPTLQNTLIVKNTQTKNLANNRKGNRFSIQLHSKSNMLESRKNLSNKAYQKMMINRMY